MRKQFFYALLAFVAIAISACRTGDYPSNIRGTWEYSDTINGVYSILDLSTSSSSASMGIPAAIYFFDMNAGEYLTKIRIYYDPSDGIGSFNPEKGTTGLQGDFEALDKEDIELNLFYVDAKGNTTELLKKAVYTYKKETNNN